MNPTPMKTTVTVLLFGSQARVSGARQVCVEVEPTATSADVLAALAESNAPLRPTLASSRLAINRALAGPSDRVGPGDELALIGPVSGG